MDRRRQVASKLHTSVNKNGLIIRFAVFAFELLKPSPRLNTFIADSRIELDFSLGHILCRTAEFKHLQICFIHFKRCAGQQRCRAQHSTEQYSTV